VRNKGGPSESQRNLGYGSIEHTKAAMRVTRKALLYHNIHHTTMEKFIPFSHLLHKGISYKRYDKCDKDFSQIEEYILTPPVLMPPISHKPLILYILATPIALGALLAQHDEIGKECAVYYISRTLVGYGLNYTSIKKDFLVVVFTSQKLRHYMLSHQINFIAKINPLKYLSKKETLIERMAKWVMILTKFDIDYVERKAIKGQAIINQLAKAPLYANNPLVLEFLNEFVFLLNEADHWKIYFDGSYTQHGSGVGVIFITQGDYIPKSYCLSFPCTNNIAEYEALIIGL
jgi:hypothetical protein